MAEKDYYKTLDVSKNASQDEIKRSFRRLARKYHPDVNPDDPTAEDKFKELQEAYEVLGDPARRRHYDQFGVADVEGLGGRGGFSSFGFEDIFSGGGFDDIFSVFTGGSRRQRRNGPRPGADIRYDLEISLESAAFGVDTEIEVPMPKVCETCNGTGSRPGTSPEDCPHCQGTGEIRSTRRTMFGQFTSITPCRDCNGTGEVNFSPCKDCGGKGKTRVSQTISISIPSGVDTGSRLRIRGQGAPGERGGPPGDLYVVIHVEPHEDFERVGDDLVVTVPVGMAQAALGTTVEVPTLKESMRFEVPPGTQSRTTFKQRNKGIPHLRGHGRGDLDIVVDVEVPETLDERGEELLREYAAHTGERVNDPTGGFLKRKKRKRSRSRSRSKSRRKRKKDK